MVSFLATPILLHHLPVLYSRKAYLEHHLLAKPKESVRYIIAN